MANYINGSSLQGDIYAKLVGDNSLASLIDGVFDEVPENPTFPYVTISEVVETADNSIHSYGRSTLINIHVWSTYRGNKESMEIAERVIELLDKQAITNATAPYNHISTHFLDFRTLKEDNGIRHGILRFRIYTIEK